MNIYADKYDIYIMTDNTKDEAMPAAANFETVSEIVGVPPRTLRSWRARGILPVTPLTEHKSVMVESQIRALKRTLEEDGRSAVLAGELTD